MRGELKPITDQGRRFVALAEEHAADFATRAAQHDTEGSFPFENIEAMKKSGFSGAPVPEQFGGMDVGSVYDYSVGMSRLARGDGSTAIAINMHLVSVLTMRRMHAVEIASGNVRLAPVIEGMLRAVAAGQLIAAVFGTEAGTALSHPNTEVKRDGDGYVLNGKKIFGTLSPAATMYFSPARLLGEDGEYRAALTLMGKGTPGVDIKDNWDAMGMRASGSGDVEYKDVKLAAGNVVPSEARLGEGATAMAEMGGVGNGGLIACFLGIAESAAEMAIDLATSRRKGPSNKTMAERPWMQHLVGEMMIDLDTCRAVLAHATRAYDVFLDRYTGTPASPEESHEVQRQLQAAKYVLNRKAIDVVDKALTISGGAGYMNKHPLSRLYRDVRAGPFMQPFSPPEALEYIGRVTLNQPPGFD